MLSKNVIEKARERTVELLSSAGIAITKNETEAIEIADFGLSDLERIGLEVLVYINTDRVCAKEIIMFPNQVCPEHIHPNCNGVPGKEETFRCRWGKVYLYVEGEKNSDPYINGLDDYIEHFSVYHEIVLDPGDQYTLQPNTKHWFRAGKEGAIVSEFSTTSTDGQDIFTDPNITRFTQISE